MTIPTIADLMDAQIFTVLKELKQEWLPLQDITEEILIFEEENDLILVGENKKRIRFDRQYVDVVRKKFKDAEWCLGAVSKRDKVKGISLLIGVMPENHYLILAPKRFKVNKK